MCVCVSVKGCVQGRIEHTAVLYLSKFSPGLFLLHPPMCYEVVEHLPCKEKEREKVRKKD